MSCLNRTFRGIVFPAIFFLLCSVVAEAKTVRSPKKIDREKAKQTYSQLQVNSRKAVAKAAKSKKAVAKFAIDEIEMDGENYSLGIKIWFELADEDRKPSGVFVDPRLYQWNPGERFFLHVESTIPSYTALFQYLPENDSTRMVYPDEKFPQSFHVTKPGDESRLPLRFITDRDEQKEFMSVLIARCDIEDVRSVAIVADPVDDDSGADDEKQETEDTAGVTEDAKKTDTEENEAETGSKEENDDFFSQSLHDLVDGNVDFSAWMVMHKGVADSLGVNDKLDKKKNALGFLKKLHDDGLAARLSRETDEIDNEGESKSRVETSEDPEDVALIFLGRQSNPVIFLELPKKGGDATSESSNSTEESVNSPSP